MELDGNQSRSPASGALGSNQQQAGDQLGISERLGCTKRRTAILVYTAVTLVNRAEKLQPEVGRCDHVQLERVCLATPSEYHWDEPTLACRGLQQKKRRL